MIKSSVFYKLIFFVCITVIGFTQYFSTNAKYKTSVERLIENFHESINNSNFERTEIFLERKYSKDNFDSLKKELVKVTNTHGSFVETKIRKSKSVKSRYGQKITVHTDCKFQTTKGEETIVFVRNKYTKKLKISRYYFNTVYD